MVGPTVSAAMLCHARSQAANASAFEQGQTEPPTSGLSDQGVATERLIALDLFARRRAGSSFAATFGPGLARAKARSTERGWTRIPKRSSIRPTRSPQRKDGVGLQLGSERRPRPHR